MLDDRWLVYEELLHFIHRSRFGERLAELLGAVLEKCIARLEVRGGHVQLYARQLQLLRHVETLYVT